MDTMYHLPRTELESQVEMLAPNMYRKSRRFPRWSDEQYECDKSGNSGHLGTQMENMKEFNGSSYTQRAPRASKFREESSIEDRG